MFVTNWISTTKIQKISEITNFFRHYFLSRTEVSLRRFYVSESVMIAWFHVSKSVSFWHFYVSKSVKI